MHALLSTGDNRAAHWLDATCASEEVFASRLLHLELVRVLRREGLDPDWAAVVTDRVSLVSVDDSLLRLAASIEPHVKSLDSIHLATCLLLGHPVAVATHDDGMKQAATALGLDVVDPIARTTP
jgi:hypothetical protein